MLFFLNNHFPSALQERIATLFGKEAALIVPTGTMGNLISGEICKHFSKSNEDL